MVCENCLYRDKHPTSRRPCLRPNGELPPQRAKTDVKPEVKPKLNTRPELLSSLDSDSQEAKKKSAGREGRSQKLRSTSRWAAVAATILALMRGRARALGW